MADEKKLNEFLKSIGESQVYYKTTPTSVDKVCVMGIWNIKDAEFVHQVYIPFTIEDDDLRQFDKLENKLARIIYDKIVLDGKLNIEFENGYEIEEERESL
jgi:hypothetical protein